MLPWILIGVGVLLFVAGTVARREIVSHVGYVSVAAAVAIWQEDDPLFRVLFGVVAWFALVLFHMYVWREVVQRLRDRAGSVPERTDPATLVGAVGDIRRLGGGLVVRVVDEDWAYVCDENLAPGTTVQVVGTDGQRLEVRRLT